MEITLEDLIKKPPLDKHRVVYVFRYEGVYPIVVENPEEILDGDFAIPSTCYTGEKWNGEIYRFEINNGEMHLRKSSKIPLEIPRIFIDNDAMVLFDAPNKRGVKISEILKNPIRIEYGDEITNCLVDSKEPSYFEIGDYEGEIETISVTTPCIVICAFTKYGNGQIKSSGVYHAASLPPHKLFKERLRQLMSNVRESPIDKTIVKATGYACSEKLETRVGEMEKKIREILYEEGAEIEQRNLLLGGERWRRTKFNPKTGELTTYFSCGKKQKNL